MATRDYSSINSIKSFAMNELAPKYFNMNETNDLNIGLLGYTTELVGTISEDSFNTITTYMNEIFPNLAVIPESIFNYGALFQIDSAFATAAQCNLLLFVPEEYIMKFATLVSGTTDLFEFYLDSNMIISVEDIRFKPDYNIKINYKRIKGNIIYTAMYDMRENNTTYKNSISDVINPYIKLKQINFEKTKYLQLEISTHQVDRFDINDNVVDSTIVNLPKYVIEYDDYIANFEVFYKEPNSDKYEQLEKRISGTSPVNRPFCYYKAIDENKIEISFTSRDNYFQPAYNSEINISYFTTLGEKGNFVDYTGTSISVIPSSEVYEYNNNIVLFALPLEGAYNGSNPLSLENLKNMIIEKFSTVGSYTNENDLQLYFDNFNNTFNSNVLFIKKRDDIFERLFSAFVLLKDSTDEIYSTNTVEMLLSPDDFDKEFEQGDIYILKPGRLFKYRPGIVDSVEIIPEKTIRDYKSESEDFLYGNPFLIYFSKSPSNTGYYLTTFENKYTIDYKYVNSDSMVQFICNSLTISRDGISGDDKYKVSLKLTPTTELDNPMVIEEVDTETGDKTVTITNSITVKLIATDSAGTDICYLDMKLESYDLDLDVYTFGCEIETDDYILDNNRFRVVNMFDINETGDDAPVLPSQHIIPMIDCILKIETGYKYANASSDKEYTITNRYLTDTNPVTFIKPIKMMRSTSKYIDNNDGNISQGGLVENGTYSISISSVPLIKAETLTDPSKYNELYKTIMTQYTYIENIIELITNNYAIDLKFYNTYGKSKNFYVGDEELRRLNKVNISIGFKIHPVFGTNEEELTRDVKIFIKDYIENINDNGTNTFYISNLIKELENNFSSIEYLKFTGINSYPTDIQAIINTTTDLDTLTKEDRITYVPEYLTLHLDDINIEIF